MNETAIARENHTWRIARWALAACLLLLPWVAMHFTDEVNWTASDFVAGGVLLFGSCALYEIAVRMSRDPWARAASAVSVAGLLLMTWINLAVGIIGTEGNPLNLVFAGIVVVAIGGAALARMRPAAMVRTLLAVAVMQLVATAVGAWAGDWRAIVLSAFFTGVWLLAAALFRHASRTLRQR